MNIDIFNNLSSFEDIEFITKLLCSYIRILSKGEGKKFTEILSNFEFLVKLMINKIDLESFMNTLISKENNINLSRNEKFRKDYYEHLNLVWSQVDSIIQLIITKNIIPSFGEKIKLRIKEYILSI